MVFKFGEEIKEACVAWLQAYDPEKIKGLDFFSLTAKPIEKKSGHNTHRCGTPRDCVPPPIEYSCGAKISL